MTAKLAILLERAMKTAIRGLLLQGISTRFMRMEELFPCFSVLVEVFYWLERGTLFKREVHSPGTTHMPRGIPNLIQLILVRGIKNPVY